MRDEKEQWIDKVLQSTDGMPRAKPRPALLAKIEHQIAFAKAKVVPLHYWKYAAIAAVFMLLVNTVALLRYHQQNQVKEEEAVIVDTYGGSLIISYQIYE